MALKQNEKIHMLTWAWPAQICYFRACTWFKLCDFQHDNVLRMPTEQFAAWIVDIKEITVSFVPGDPSLRTIKGPIYFYCCDVVLSDGIWKVWFLKSAIVGTELETRISDQILAKFDL